MLIEYETWLRMALEQRSKIPTRNGSAYLRPRQITIGVR
jgi:hypothetical protein